MIFLGVAVCFLGTLIGSITLAGWAHRRLGGDELLWAYAWMVVIGLPLFSAVFALVEP